MTEIALGKPCPCLSSVIVSCCLASFPCNPGTEIFVQSLLFPYFLPKEPAKSIEETSPSVWASLLQDSLPTPVTHLLYFPFHPFFPSQAVAIPHSPGPGTGRWRMESHVVNPHFAVPASDLLPATRHEDSEARSRAHLLSIPARGWLISHFKGKEERSSIYWVKK